MCIFLKNDQQILKIVADHEKGLMNILWLATLVWRETIRENRTATEKTQFHKLAVNPSPTWARPYPVLPLHPYLHIYSLCYAIAKNPPNGFTVPSVQHVLYDIRMIIRNKPIFKLTLEK
jgi:hypothetical protein